MNYYDILLAKKLNKGGGEITVEGLSVTENGTYSEVGKAYSPVVVNVELPNDALKIKSASGTIATFTDGQNLVMPKCEVEINAVQSGSGDPSPTNIRPISGWSAVDVTRCGKNLWGGEKLADDIVSKVPQATKDTTNKTVTYSANNASGVSLFNTFKQNTQYTLIFSAESKYTNLRIDYTDGSYDALSPNSYYVSSANKSIASIKGAWYSGTTVLKYEECGIFEGVITAQNFETYNEQTYTIDLDGTRYGGTLDVVSGVLTLTHGYIASYNGETLPSTWISDRDVYVEGTSPTTGAQVVYELATPITYRLNPTAIKSLLGNNNVWADTNGDIDLEYFSKIE